MVLSFDKALQVWAAEQYTQQARKAPLPDDEYAVESDTFYSGSGCETCSYSFEGYAITNLRTNGSVEVSMDFSDFMNGLSEVSNRSSEGDDNE